MQQFFTKLFFLTFFSLLILGNARAQEQVYNTEQVQITTRLEKLKPKDIKELIQSSKRIFPTNSDSAMQILYHSLQASILINYKDGIDSSLSIMSIYWYKNLDNSHQYALLEATLKLVQALDKEDKNIAILYYTSGQYLSVRGLYSQALLQQQKALEAIPENNTEKILNTIRIQVYNQLGALWILLNEPNQAMTWWNKAETEARLRKDIHQLIRILRNKGTFYYNNGQLDTSYQILMDAFKLGKENPSIHRNCGCIRFTISALCLTLLGQHKPDEAMAYLNEEIMYATEKWNQSNNSATGINDELLHLYFLKGYTYFEQGKYTKAEQVLLPALASAELQNFSGIEKNIIGLLSMIYGITEQYKKAYKYLNDFNALDKKIIKDQKGSAVDFHIQYLENEKQKELTQQELIVLQQESKIKNRNFLIGGSIITIILLCILFIFIYYNIRRRQGLKQELIQLQSIMKGEEKERARLAQELHDGIVVQFSAVKMNLSTLPNNYEDLKQASEFHDIISSLDNATRELRKTAHHLMPDMLLEDGLTEATFYFCKSLIQNKDLSIDFQHYGELPRLEPEFELSVYRIIQELVQNILKHAYATSAMVQISYNDDNLNITIEDNGQGFVVDEVKNGMGLRSIRARAKALNGIFDIQSTPGKGTIVYLEFDTKNITKPS